ncbi:energy transducer TonB [Owenweeksia hongkongensis]|uniref:energy transducer TonB n=1 Tax=Owenweeksia hongkongensis TaxID=253245 RepID=UPI003A906C96
MFKEIWNDKDRRKGLIGSITFHAILLLLFLFVGLKYYEPKPEDGIVINFGNSETGMGDQADGAQQTVVETTPEETTPEPVESPSDAVEPTQTQDVVDAPAVETKKAEKPKKVEEPKPVEPEKPKPSSELEKMLESVKSSKAGGEGEKKGEGDQGAADGDPNSKSRTGGSTGGGGTGGTGNYMLGGRQALNKPKPEYPCTEEGRVVVKIYVDQNGKVTNAIPGERVPGGSATTTTSSCLFDKAKAAAMRTTWQPDGDAPNPQIGYIVYNFQKQ